MLTNAAVRAARPRGRAYKRFDERGLFLFVAPSGLKAWRLRFRFEGREQLLSLGQWPEVELDEARSRADDARARLARGEDPRVRAIESRRRLEEVARAWLADRRGRWGALHAADVESSLARLVFPAIGALRIDAVTPGDVIELVQSIERRGAVETARRVRQRLDAIFAFAIARQLASANPARLIAGELAGPRARARHPAITDPAELAQLLARIDALPGAAAPKLAARLLALTAVRLGSIRAARWGEFEGLDGPAPLWRIPPAHLKLTRIRKADESAAHLVPLVPAAVEVLRAARAIAPAAGPDDEVFRRLGENGIRAAHRRAGAGNRHVPHGWRASFATILNEAMPGERAAIDQALAHVAKDKVEAAYNRSEQLARRRRLFEIWADLIAPAPLATGGG